MKPTKRMILRLERGPFMMTECIFMQAMVPDEDEAESSWNGLSDHITSNESQEDPDGDAGSNEERATTSN